MIDRRCGEMEEAYDRQTAKSNSTTTSSTRPGPRVGIEESD